MASLGVSQDIGNRKEQQDAAFAQDLVNLKVCNMMLFSETTAHAEAISRVAVFWVCLMGME